ncbi:hypothetical protein ACFT8P_36320 [Streptomyces sp. NPDC057101]|uniref:hypothetical protein n=1 Tax=Streptomyces sp. NPDC057101 TaxID=3346020 RepID=UPI003635BCF4
MKRLSHSTSRDDFSLSVKEIQMTLRSAIHFAINSVVFDPRLENREVIDYDQEIGRFEQAMQDIDLDEIVSTYPYLEGFYENLGRGVFWTESKNGDLVGALSHLVAIVDHVTEYFYQAHLICESGKISELKNGKSIYFNVFKMESEQGVDSLLCLEGERSRFIDHAGNFAFYGLVTKMRGGDPRQRFSTGHFFSAGELSIECEMPRRSTVESLFSAITNKRLIFA